MDELKRTVLEAEVREDLRVSAETAVLARQRFGTGTDPELEACAYQLARFYNIVEALGLRIARAFENHIDDEQGWHMELVRRLSIEIPEVRPPLFSSEIVPDLQELRAFRHIVRHTYDLRLQASKIIPLLDAVDRLATGLPAACDRFFSRVREALSE